jgi:hypothetical protein
MRSWDADKREAREVHEVGCFPPSNPSNVTLVLVRDFGLRLQAN